MGICGTAAAVFNLGLTAAGILFLMVGVGGGFMSAHAACSVSTSPSAKVRGSVEVWLFAMGLVAVVCFCVVASK